MSKKNKKQLKVNIPKENSEGIYSNVVFTNFNQSEFILDFARIMPGVPEAKVYARILLNPQHTKRLYKLLERNIEKFEEKFSEIDLPENISKQGVGFQTTE